MMTSVRNGLLGLLLVGAACSAQAAIDTYEFSDDAQRMRYRLLVEELRCPKCQNQNIADSNAPIAMDLRQEVYRMMQAGQSDAEIVDYLVARYGDFVRYKPPLDARTWVLWLGPVALLLLGAVVLGVIAVRRREASRGAADAQGLSDVEQQRLQDLLEHKDS